jgi:hypothetical protein
MRTKHASRTLVLGAPRSVTYLAWSVKHIVMQGLWGLFSDLTGETVVLTSVMKQERGGDRAARLGPWLEGVRSAY